MHNTDRILSVALHPKCTLAYGCRLLVVVLAQHANWRTGYGISGQGRLARAMGCSTRNVGRQKAALAAASGSPVTVTWSHRSRPDGLNGSDSYVIRLSEVGVKLLGLLDSGQPGKDSGQMSGTLTTSLPTNSSRVVPTGVTTALDRNENVFEGYGPLDQPNLIETNWQPNRTHVASAKKLGVDLQKARASFVAYHTAHGGLRTKQGWDRGFGGWIKRNEAASRSRAPVESAEEAAEAEWQAQLTAQAAENDRQFWAKEAEYDAAEAAEAAKAAASHSDVAVSGAV